MEKLLPKLRFPEFKGEWEEKKLGEVSQKIMYGMNSAAIDFDGTNKYLRITDIDENSREFIPKPLVSPDGNIEEKYKLKIGDIVFTRTGASVGKTYLYNPKDGNLLFAGFLIKFSIIKGNPYFIFLQTLKDNYIKWVLKMSMRSGQPGLNAEECKDLKLSFPTLHEQTKIATFLTEVDKKLTALKQKKTLLEQYKKGVMQQIFSHELRFKNDNGNDFPDWEEKMLGEVARITTGSSNRIDSNLDGEFTFFDRSQDIRSSNSFLFDTEAIIVPGEGQEFIPKYFIGKFDLHQRTYAVMNFKNQNGKFLFYSISYNSNHLNSHAVGSTVKSLRLPMFEKMPVNLPILQEQTKIANFLSAIDDKINHCQGQIEKTQVWKKGLLQQLFV